MNMFILKTILVMLVCGMALAALINEISVRLTCIVLGCEYEEVKRAQGEDCE